MCFVYRNDDFLEQLMVYLKLLKLMSMIGFPFYTYSIILLLIMILWEFNNRMPGFGM
jgi:hypothetical protein